MPEAGDMAGDESYRGFRITELWAVVAVDPEDDQEGICSIPTPGGAMPLVGSDRNRLASFLEPIAVDFRAAGIPAEVKHFALMDVGGQLQASHPETLPAAELHSDPEWRAYVSHVQGELIPKVESSDMSMLLVPKGETDVKFAIELGLSIMLNKPILAMVPKGAELPPRLAKVADCVIEWDPDDAGTQAFVGSEIAQFARDVEAGKYA